VLTASADSGQVNDALATDVGNASAALALAEARLRAEVLQVLSPEQRAAVQQRAAERAARFNERRERVK
jgi:Spy/CpxP family protein refolding chaperone